MNLLRLVRFFTTSLLLPGLLLATDLTPWLTKDLEFQSQLSGLFQFYPKIAAKHGSIHRSGNDQFYTFSLALSAFDWSGEIESTLAHTRRQDYLCDNVRLTGRYRWLDDIPGDAPFSLVTGLTLTQAFKHSLRDISSFHHGQFEAEAHIAIGKECSCERFWSSRWWGVFALGHGNHGDPWLRTESAWEKNWWDTHQLRVFANSLWGLGNKRISTVNHFRGYGPIAHQSIDIGLRYTYLFEFSGIISFEYAYRPYASNFPENTSLLFARFLYPFGL